MSLDLRTIYLMDAALYLMLHAAIWIGLIQYRSRTVATWSLSGIVSALGLVFLGMRGVWPDWALVIIGQSLMAAGNLGRQMTLRSMLGPLSREWMGGQALFNAVYMAWGLYLFLQGGDYLPGLVLLFYGFYTLNLLEYVFIGHAMRRKAGFNGAWAIEFAGLAFCISLGIKTVALLGGWGEVSLYTMAWDQAVVFIGQFVAISLINVGFLQAFVGQIQDSRLRAENEAKLQQQKFDMLVQHAQEVGDLLKEREELIRQLTLSNKSAGMGALVASIAHEVNQPLTALVIKAELIESLLLQTPKAQAVTQLGGEIREDALRISHIVRTLRTLFMTSKGKHECIDLSTLVRDVLLIVEGRRLREGIDLHPQLSPGTSVMGDVTQLQQVVLNLLNNAMEAVLAAPAPTIVVCCEIQGPQVVLTVKDNGEGMDAQRQSEVFSLFKTSKAQGMGVGLWLSRSIVETHGGGLAFQSEPEHGTVFKLTLPVCQNSQFPQFM